MGKIINKIKEFDDVRVCEIAAHLDVANSTVYNHLTTLEKIGLITREDDVYKLSPLLVHFGSIVRRENPIYNQSSTFVDRLARQTGEQAFFVVPHKGRGIVMSQARGDQAISIGPEQGDFVYLHDTAAGQAILAAHTDNQIEMLLDEWGLPKQAGNTITEMDELLERIRTVRDRGYAVTRDERVDEVVAIGTAIVIQDEIVGALCVAGLSHQLEGERLEAVQKSLQTAATKLRMTASGKSSIETPDSTGMTK